MSHFRKAFLISALLVVFAVQCLLAQAQSIDPSKPTPIRNNTLNGKIAARDLGDSRLTDHYYAFTGTPGDLLITIQSRNLNGDVDVFTATTLRPLLKVTLYAESPAPVTKGIYLRRREDLILRVEARSPNDDEGSYQFFFGGSFEAIAGGEDESESQAETAANPNATGRRGNRVNSVGARIAEPEPSPAEVAATPTPEPTPEAVPTETPAPKPTARKTTTTPPATARSRRPVSRRTTTAAKPKPTPDAEAKNNEEAAKPTEEKPKEESAAGEPEVATTTPPRPKSRRNTTARSGTTARPVRTQPAKPAPAESEQPDVGPRLIIETNDGTLINRSMSTVKRVTVENGLIVILGKDGKFDRVPLANVVKMTIQPQ
ncbi:MAG: hypothetical protein C5B55_09400 [Blastocatellia bacterium]|nr:MAG: hypothetical protein C5B55_09400 [Blastocatellia bacterium]